MADDLVFEASLDDSEVIKALKNIDRNIDKLAKSADSDFKKTGDSATKAGAKIGAIAGITQRVTDAIINLGRQAINSLKQILSESVDLAKVQVAAEAQLAAAIKSTGNASGLTAAELKKLASELQNVTNFGDEAVIESEALLLTFKKIGEETFPRALKAILDTSVGMKQDLKTSVLQIGKALNDPIAGLGALTRVGIQFSDGLDDQVKALAKAGKTAEAQALILGELESQFKGSAEAAREADGGITAFGNAIGDLQEKIGLPIIQALSDNIEGILSNVADNKEALDNLATAIGNLAAASADFVATNILGAFEDIDPKDLQQLADALNDASLAISDLAGSENQQQIDSLIDLLTITVDLFTYVANAINKAKDAAEGAIVPLDGLASSLAGVFPGFGAVKGIKDFVDDFDTLNNLVKQFTGKEIDDYTRATVEASKTTAQLAEEQARLQEQKQKAAKDRGGKPITTDDVIEPEVPEEVQKVLDKLADLERDAFRDLVDIRRKAAQKAHDTEEDFIQKRIDQARKFLQQIEDVERKNNQAIADSAKDLSRDEQDARRDFNRKQIDLEKDQAKKKIEIEEDYREELRRINQRFQDDADEAARNRDAVTFLRLQRQRDREIEEAKITRTQKVQESGKEGEEKRQQLQQELEYQLEDARIADDRRLEDLRVRLQRELEEARIKNQQELDDITTYENRKRNELSQQLNLQIEEAKIANRRRVNDYKESLDEEVKALVESEQKKREIMQERARSAESSRYSGLAKYYQGRQHGGPVGSGQPVIVGEAGPEIFQPSVGGNIVPLGPGIMSPLMGNNIMNTVNNIQNASVNQNFGANQDAISAAIARNAAIEVIRGILS